MKRIVLFLVSVIMISTIMLSSAAYASFESSLYLAGYTAYIDNSGNTININYEVLGTRKMDKIGVTEIYLYEKATSSSSWTLVETFLSSDPTYTSTMIGTNTGFKMDKVTYSGDSDYQYKAYVTIYAEKDGGSDSRNLIVYY